MQQRQQQPSPSPSSSSSSSLRAYVRARMLHRKLTEQKKSPLARSDLARAMSAALDRLDYIHRAAAESSLRHTAVKQEVASVGDMLGSSTLAETVFPPPPDWAAPLTPPDSALVDQKRNRSPPPLSPPPLSSPIVDVTGILLRNPDEGSGGSGTSEGDWRVVPLDASEARLLGHVRFRAPAPPDFSPSRCCWYAIRGRLVAGSPSPSPSPSLSSAALITRKVRASVRALTPETAVRAIYALADKCDRSSAAPPLVTIRDVYRALRAASTVTTRGVSVAAAAAVSPWPFSSSSAAVAKKRRRVLLLAAPFSDEDDAAPVISAAAAGSLDEDAQAAKGRRRGRLPPLVVLDGGGGRTSPSSLPPQPPSPFAKVVKLEVARRETNAQIKAHAAAALEAAPSVADYLRERQSRVQRIQLPPAQPGGPPTDLVIKLVIPSSSSSSLSSCSSDAGGRPPRPPRPRRATWAEIKAELHRAWARTAQITPAAAPPGHPDFLRALARQIAACASRQVRAATATAPPRKTPSPYIRMTTTTPVLKKHRGH